MHDGIFRALTPALAPDPDHFLISWVMATPGSSILPQAMKRSRTSSTIRPEGPLENISSRNSIDQRSLTVDDTRAFQDSGDPDQSTHSEQWEDAHTDLDHVRSSVVSGHYDEGRTNTAAVNQILPSRSTSRKSERNGLAVPKDQDTSTPLSDTAAIIPSFCRKINSRSAMGQMALDLCITITPVCFLVLAAMAVLQSGRTEQSGKVQATLSAARFVSPPYLTR